MENSSAAVLYRLLLQTEYELYRTIRLECLREVPDNFGPSYEEEVHATTLKFSHIFREHTTDDFIYGAFIDGQLVGICGFVREQMIKTRHRGHITQMYVKGEFAGKGIGSALLQAVLDRAFTALAIEQITLTVVATNEPAIALYRNKGFTQYGILEQCIRNESGDVADIFMVLKRDDYQNVRLING